MMASAEGALRWWRERGEPTLLTALALLALSGPALVALGVLLPDQAWRMALLAACGAGALLLLRLPGWLLREGRRAVAIVAVVAVALSTAAVLQPAPLASQSGLTFVAPPRISREVFVSVLRRGTGGGPSPAAPYASELYDIIAGYGIDPGVALAFFAHESQLCTVGVCADYDTKNWGAQRRPVRAGRAVDYVPGRTGTFVRYGNWQDGVRDWCELILGRYVGRGLDTVEKAVPVYAPRSDGNVPTSYINVIYRLVRGWQGRQAGAVAAPNERRSVYEGSLDEALVVETFLSAELEYRPAWAFHKFMVEAAQAGRPLGAPLSESRVITVGGQGFAIQVFANDTLYTPLAQDVEQTNWSDVRRMSDLLATLPQEGEAAEGAATAQPAPLPANIPGMVFLPRSGQPQPTATPAATPQP